MVNKPLVNAAIRRHTLSQYFDSVVCERVEVMSRRISDLFNWTMLWAALGCLLGMATTGCAVVEEIHSDGATSRSLAFAAPVVVNPDPNNQGSVVKVTGLGFLVSNNSATLGL